MESEQRTPGDAVFDESTSRLFIGTRTPPEMIVMDSQSGREIAHLATAEGMDGVYFDKRRKRVYVSGGREWPAGFAHVYRQKSADHYDNIGKIPTREGAGTSFWSAEFNRYYVAASANAKQTPRFWSTNRTIETDSRATYCGQHRGFSPFPYK